MTGYALAYSACVCCKRVFGYNPIRVPSTSAVTGTKEPICRNCIDLINEKRALVPLPLWPIPPDAYEPVDEGELP